MFVELCILGVLVLFGQFGIVLFFFLVYFFLFCNMVLKKVEFEVVYELWIWICYLDNYQENFCLMRWCGDYFYQVMSFIISICFYVK